MDGVQDDCAGGEDVSLFLCNQEKRRTRIARERESGSGRSRQKEGRESARVGEDKERGGQKKKRR